MLKVKCIDIPDNIPGNILYINNIYETRFIYENKPKYWEIYQDGIIIYKCNTMFFKKYFKLMLDKRKNDVILIDNKS